MELAVGFLPDGVGAAVAALLIAASFFTSALTAAFGVGGGIAVLALLGLFVPVAALIPVHGLVQLGSNTGRAWVQRAAVRRDIALPFIAGSLVGAAAGTTIVVQVPDAPLKLALGLFVIAVTWWTVPGFDRLGKAGLAVGASAVAFLTMFLGATGPLLNAFFAQIIRDDRKALVATHAAGMTVHHGLKVMAFAIAGFSFGSWAPMVMAMIVSGYLGTIYGSKLLERLPEKQFRLAFKIGLSLLAVDLARRGLAGLI
ncbi:MAG: sulfite exporter TauE/SafE family protein [Phyllobacteriaceae bacterium]|nr:sulfite exporter TauE/SafE family protein [Phyllobacteriaceae bacterium]